MATKSRLQILTMPGSDEICAGTKDDGKQTGEVAAGWARGDREEWGAACKLRDVN